MMKTGTITPAISYVTIETLSPVVLTAPDSSQILTGSSDFFSGTLVRGLWAGEYVKKHHCGDKAHADQTFLDYFFGGLRFLAANPVLDGQRSFTLPLSLMKAKKKSEDKQEAKEYPQIMDLFTGTPMPGYKGLKGLATIHADQISLASVKRSVNFHMSRTSTNERLGGHSQAGKVYTYESIDAGQVFQGAILGDEALLTAFFTDLGQKGKAFNCRVGRSQNTTYGLCRLTLQKPCPLTLVTWPQKVILRLDAPLIPVQGKATQAVTILQQEVADKLNQLTKTTDFSIPVAQVFSAAQKVENFVRIWGMRRPRQQALAAGTAFVLEKKGNWSSQDKQALQQLMYGGVGLRREEGFGQLRFWQHDALTLAQTESQEKQAKVAVTSPEVIYRLKLILRKNLQEVLRNFAYQDVQKMQGLQTSSKTHAFATLENWLGRRKTTGKAEQEAFLQKFKQQILQEPGKPLERHLHEIHLQYRELYDIFSKGGNIPLNGQRKEKLQAVLPPALVKLAGLTHSTDTYFYDYWLWVFRYGRKRAVQMNKKGVD